MMEIDDITGVVVDAAVKIHRDLGCSLFESVYEVALAAVLERRGLHVVRQQQLGFTYEGMEFGNAFRADLVVERCVMDRAERIDTEYTELGGERGDFCFAWDASMPTTIVVLKLRPEKTGGPTRPMCALLRALAVQPSRHSATVG